MRRPCKKPVIIAAAAANARNPNNADKRRQKPTHADEKFQDFFIVCQPLSASLSPNLDKPGLPALWGFWPGSGQETWHNEKLNS
jgi:hypothetical protein